MSDVRKYVQKRKAIDPEFAAGFDAGYEDFKIGVLLRQAREAAGMTQDEVARRLGTKKSAISRMENHADDVRLSTLRNYAEAVGASLEITLAQARQHLVREERVSYQVGEVAETEDAQDEAERQRLAQSEQLRSILDDAEARIRATGGVQHEDVWSQIDAEFSNG
ncbi:MAG: helix-turn-helix transcriptional regulator [Anaerolineae bacterium]